MTKLYFYDDQGHIGEVEAFPDGICVTRLIQPGGSRSTIRASADNSVVILHFEGVNPDLLYDRFEGSPESCVNWLNERGFF